MRYRTSRILDAMHAEKSNPSARRAAEMLRANPRESFREIGLGCDYAIGDAFGDDWRIGDESRLAFVERLAERLVSEAARLKVPMEDL